MFKRFAAVVAAGVLVATGLATGTANAAPVLTDTVQIRNNIDSGTHGSWAWIDHRRSVSISLVDEGEGDQPDTYSVVLTDVGTLRTIKGAKSPQAGVTIPREVSGNFSGRYTFTVTSDSKPSTSGVHRWRDYRCQISGTCVGKISSDDWPKQYFDGDVTVTSNNDWRWVYTTCAERWVNASAAVGGNSGDITGKRCDRTVRADEPTVTQPACDTVRGKLTVPSDRGVYYRVNGRVWRAGSYDVRPGRYLVTAHARDGYRLVGDQRWRLTVERAEACPTASPTPTVTPTETVSPTPTENPATEVVTPEAPTLEQATCDDKTASITIPKVAGVVYKSASGTVLEQGKSYSVDAGNVGVTAEAADGYTLAEGAKTEWTFVVSETPDCPTATPTVTTPVTVVNNIPVPSRVDTGLGGLAR